MPKGTARFSSDLERSAEMKRLRTVNRRGRKASERAVRRNATVQDAEAARSRQGAAAPPKKNKD